MDAVEQQLIGCWKTDQRPADLEPEDGDVTIEFKPDGTAVYSMYYPDKIQKALLTYKIDGNHIITDQPSHPSIQKTDFSIEKDGSLILSFNGVRGRFLRI